MLRLKLLGGLSVCRDGRPLSGALAQPRRLAVLALLARGGPAGVSRDNVINTLWPDTDEERASHVQPDAVRPAPGGSDDEIIVGVRELRLDTELLASDVAEFQGAVAAHDLERAVDLYDGPFLDGFHVPGSDEFERWVDHERASLNRTYADTLEQLARDATARHDLSRATHWCRKRARAIRSTRASRSHSCSRSPRAATESAPFSTRACTRSSSRKSSRSPPTATSFARRAATRAHRCRRAPATVEGPATVPEPVTADSEPVDDRCLMRRRNRSPNHESLRRPRRPATSRSGRLTQPNGAYDAPRPCSRLRCSQRPRCSAPPVSARWRRA